MTPSGAGAAGLLPGGSRRVWGGLEGCAELEGSWEQGKGRAGRGGLGGSSGRVPSCPLIVSPCVSSSPPHLISPCFSSCSLASPCLPSPASCLPYHLPSCPLMSSCHLPSCPVYHLPSFPLIVSPHRVLSCPLVISPCHLLSSSLLVSPRVPSSRPLLSPCVPSSCPPPPLSPPLLSPGRRAGLHPTPASPRPQRGRGSVTHFPPGPASLPPWPRAGDASREPQHSSGTWGRVGRPRHSSVPDPASGCCPRGGKGGSWVSACRAPDPPGVTVSPCPARGAAGGDRGSGGSILLHGSIPGGGRLSRGRCPGHREPLGVEAGLGFVAEGRVPVVPRSERGRGPAGPAAGSGRCRSGRLSLQIPPVRCCRRWRKSFGREMMTG